VPVRFGEEVVEEQEFLEERGELVNVEVTM